MLQLELRINGVLVDFVDIRRITDLGPLVKQELKDSLACYQIRHGDELKSVVHDRNDGALVLAAKALAEITGPE